ncbi:MAG TPA: hypothetical protein VE568_12305 [Rubrobacter sp.]|nr:hypothetical protein [Rubrobacter sp.]
MGPQNPKDVARDIIRDLTGLVWELSSMKEDAAHWLEGPEYGTLRHRPPGDCARSCGGGAGGGEAAGEAGRGVGAIGA